MSPTCRCTWPTVVPASTCGCGFLVRDQAHQAREVERLGAADRGRVAQVAPVLAAAVGGELDAVVVGVGQVDRLGDAVVGRAADARAGDREAGGGAGELEPRRVQEREVVEPGVAAGAAGVRVLDEDEQVLAAGAERGAVAVAAVQSQADRGLVEVDRAVEVGDGRARRRPGAAWRGGRERRSGSRRSWRQDRSRARVLANGRTSPMHGLPARAVAVGLRRLARGGA